MQKCRSDFTSTVSPRRSIGPLLTPRHYIIREWRTGAQIMGDVYNYLRIRRYGSVHNIRSQSSRNATSMADSLCSSCLSVVVLISPSQSSSLSGSNSDAKQALQPQPLPSPYMHAGEKVAAARISTLFIHRRDVLYSSIQYRTYIRT